LNAEIDAIIHLRQGKKKLNNCQRSNLFSSAEHFIWLPSISLLCVAAMLRSRSRPGISPNRAIFPAPEQIAANDEQQSVLADPTPTRIKLSRRNLVQCTRILETLNKAHYCMIVRCGMERPSCEE
jgi:hypothetical protein